MFKKRCPKCGETKKRGEFNKDKNKKNGLTSQCIECCRAYRRSKRGLIFIIYSTQKSSSKERGHRAPSYSRDDLLHWVISQDLFHVLYKNWVKSGYKNSKKPSVDRIDDYLGYTFENIQLMTWGENEKKGSDDRRDGVNNKNSKVVFQFTKEGEFITEYHSAHEASRQMGIYRTSISRVCRGVAKTAGGYIWRYAEDCS